MIVKKFQGATETEAVLKAKEELGSQAVVLSVKTLKQRGIFKLFKKDVVEITAALEEKEFINGIKDKKPKFSDKLAESSSNRPNTKVNSNASINYVADEKIDIVPESAAIEEKLDSLHTLLRTQMDKETDKKAASVNSKAVEDNNDNKSNNIIKQRENANFKFLQLIYNKLIDNDVDERYANLIISEIENSIKKESNIDSLLAGVYQKIILKLGEPKPIVLGKKPKIVFFIGPTGVGKTTTIAKIASKFKIENECKVAFITADTYRIAAVEQLNTYASIIDCPVDVVYSSDEIEESINQYSEYELILIDTAGRSHKSEEQMNDVVDLYNNLVKSADKYDIEVFLTLSVTTKYKDLVRITEAYKDIPGYKIIFTKLDETCSLGNILNIKMLTNASLSYTTSGQNVPNDIEVVNEQGLAKQLLGGNE